MSGQRAPLDARGCAPGCRHLIGSGQPGTLDARGRPRCARAVLDAGHRTVLDARPGPRDRARPRCPGIERVSMPRRTWSRLPGTWSGRGNRAVLAPDPAATMLEDMQTARATWNSRTKAHFVDRLCRERRTYVLMRGGSLSTKSMDIVGKGWMDLLGTASSQNFRGGGRRLAARNCLVSKFSGRERTSFAPLQARRELGTSSSGIPPLRMPLPTWSANSSKRAYGAFDRAGRPALSLH
jgi:hypothetical protein